MMSRSRPWGAVDRGMVQLVRLVLADDWHPATAAAQLRELVQDPQVLCQMAGRIRRAHGDRSSQVAERSSQVAERSSQVAERAVLTLGIAINEVVA